MRLKDCDVRTKLHQEIQNHFLYDKTTHIVDELQICNGVARIDIAAINGSLHGYEIKSESDTLVRLPNQIEQYNKVFDFIYFVCADNQIDKAYQLIPDWWGVYIVTNNNGMAQLNMLRAEKKNNNLDAFSLLQFLNKEELIQFGIKFDLGTKKSLKKIQKYRLWQFFAAKVDKNDIGISELCDYLRLALKSREGERIHLLQK